MIRNFLAVGVLAEGGWFGVPDPVVGRTSRWFMAAAH